MAMLPQYVLSLLRSSVGKDDFELTTFIIVSAFFLRVDRPVQDPPTPAGQLRPLAIAKQQGLEPTAYYVWLMASSPLSTYIGSAAMVAVILASVMFPLWPPIMRQGVSYLSMGVLGLIGLFIAVGVVRLVIWLITRVLLKKAIWWFPNLFEDVGFVSTMLRTYGTPVPAEPQAKLPLTVFRSIRLFLSGAGMNPLNLPHRANPSPRNPAKKSVPTRTNLPHLVRPLKLSSKKHPLLSLVLPLQSPVERMRQSSRTIRKALAMNLPPVQSLRLSLQVTDQRWKLEVTRT